MKKIITLMTLSMLLTLFSGCSAYVRYPSVGVSARIHPHNHYRCRWVYQDGGRFKQCLTRRGWVYVR